MEEVCGLMGDIITTATLAKIETRQMGLTVDYMEPIAKALQVSEADLLPKGNNGRTLPVLGHVAAGNWREAITEPSGYRAIPGDVKTGTNSFILLPEGDSMDKLVGPAGYIVIDPDQRELQGGRLYTMMNQAGEATFKRFLEGPPRLEPCSSNPEHAVLPLGHEPIFVVGRVTFIGDPDP